MIVIGKSKLRLAPLVLLTVLAQMMIAPAHTRGRPIRIAVISFGDSATAERVTERITKSIASNDAADVIVIDTDQTKAASAGSGFNGSLNLTLEEARNLGAAIDCDFYILAKAQVLRRSPSDGPAYFEAYASLFLVSTRTGKLIRWERLDFRRSTPAEAEKILLAALAAPGTRHRYHVDIRRTEEDEREARARAVEVGTPVIEVMSDDEASSATRPPRPYRRTKPSYPEAAAHDNIEATVDVLADIDEKGEVRHTEIARWAGYGLDESVVSTVKQMHFFPAMRDGRAIPMRVLLRYNFRKPHAQQ